MALSLHLRLCVKFPITGNFNDFPTMKSVFGFIIVEITSNLCISSFREGSECSGDNRQLEEI